MILWIRNLVVLFALLSVAFVCLSMYYRSKAKDRLRSQYAASDRSVDEKEFMAEGMKQYEASLQPKLLILVYLIPALILALLMFLAYQ